MGLHRWPVNDPQPGARAIGGSRRGLRSSLQPVGTPAGGYVASCFEGLVVAWLGGQSTRIGSLGRPHTRLRRGRSRADSGGAPLARR
jgi:hypothetical protein